MARRPFPATLARRMRAAIRYLSVVAGLGAAFALGAMGACASDEPADTSKDDSGFDAPVLGDAGPPEAEAAVPLGDVCGASEGLEKESPWPLRGGCPKRAGVSENAGPQAATVKWSVPMPAGESSPAISADNVVWVGTADGDVIGLSGGGVVQGAFRTGGPVRSSPARSAPGLTIIGGSDGKLYAVERLPEPPDAGADGGDAGGDGGYPAARAIWSLAVAPMSSSPAIGDDGTIYVGTTTGKLVAVAGDGSAAKWSATTNDTLGSSPCIAADGTIYVGSSDRKLYAFAPDGKPKWSFETGGVISGSPVVGGDETIYVGSTDGKLYALAPDGKPRWTFATGGPITGSPAVRGGIVYVGSDDKKLHAVATTTGTATWSYATLGAVATPVIGADRTVYVGSADGNLYALTPAGLLYFAVKARGKIHSTPAIGADETLYVTTDTALVAIGR
jgi:outer membrane protein assembly factor BamB